MYERARYVMIRSGSWAFGDKPKCGVNIEKSSNLSVHLVDEY